MATGRTTIGRRSKRRPERSGAARPQRDRVRVHEGEHGRELIVDETFASLYRPGHIATGCVWDAIAAPLLWLPPERRRSVLVLGLAGGSAARIARALAPDALIVGVELDAEVVAVARDAFELDALGLELVVDDALAVLKRERRHFDAILEDIFVGRGDAVRKPDWIPEPAHRLAAKRLRPGGVLVTNTLDEAAVVGRALVAAHEAVVRIEIEDYDNRIFVAGPEGLSARGLRAAVAASPVLAGSLPLMRFRSWQRA
jgi:spermidine synthase